MTKNTKIIIAVVAIILIAIFWKQISSIWNGSSNERSSKNEPEPTPLQPTVQFPIECDPKHYGYDKSGQPRKECGYKPAPVQPSQPTCAQLMEQINDFKKKILTAPNPQQLSYLQQYIKKLELQYASMDCGGGPRPAPVQ